MKICTNCGYQNIDTTPVCYYCGHPFPKLKKKSKAPIILAVLAAVIILTVGGIFASNLISFNKFEIPEFDNLRSNMTQSDVIDLMGTPYDKKYTSASDSVFGFGYTTFTYNYQLGEYNEGASFSFSTKNGTLSYVTLDISYKYYFDDNQLSEKDISLLEDYKQDLIDYFTEKLGSPSLEHVSDYEEKTVYTWIKSDGSTIELRVEDEYDFDYMELWWHTKYEYNLYY